MPKGNLTFEIEKCKGCGLCVAFCPVKILYLDNSTLNQSGYNIVKVTDSDKCIACASCAIMCPDSIITVEVKN